MILRAATWRRVAGAGALGAIAGFGQEPYGYPIVLFAALIVVFRLFASQRSVNEAAVFGWAFGAGFFAHVLQWIVSPFMVDVARHGWMAPFALVLMAGGLALFWALAFALARRLAERGCGPLVFFWTSAELLRAYMFTGFPWAMPAQALVDTVLGQTLSWVGPYVLNAMTFAAAAALSIVLRDARWRFAQVVLLTTVLAALLMPPLVPPPQLTAHSVRLVQPNAAQRDRMDPAKDMLFFDRQLAFTATPPGTGDAPPDLVIWPEVAVPWPLRSAPAALAEIAAASEGSPVVLGAIRLEAGQVYNAMAVVGPGGEVQQTYDKHHLVPFGEYVPFSSVMDRLGIFGLSSQAWRGLSAGPGARLIDLGPLGQALPLICYEVVFAHDVNAAPARPQFLMQLTNDAWFGRSAGPRQHLAQARMRAIEQGLPLARSANTGISAMIDPWGRVTRALPLNQAGFLDAPLPHPRAPTLYSRTGDVPLIALVLMGLTAFSWRIIRNRR
ncbi:MAG: apolipoprotein N-acyltransferase [Pseudomonadota bacterium]